MFKKIKEIKNIVSITKKVQSKITGGNTSPADCFGVSQDICERRYKDTCKWYGKFCGPKKAHIPSEL